MFGSLHQVMRVVDGDRFVARVHFAPCCDRCVNRGFGGMNGRKALRALSWTRIGLGKGRGVGIVERGV